MTHNSSLPLSPALQDENRTLPAWVPQSNLAWFAFIFAFWILVDISLMRWLSKYAFCISAPLAMAVLLRPNNVKLFIAMVAASLWAWWLKMPFVVNVIMVGAFFSLVILISTLLFGLRHRRWPTMSEIEERIFPIFRIGVPVVWLFAVLHKTNWDFLDPDISCAVLHYKALRHYLPFLPSPEAHKAVGYAAVWTAWAFEFSVPTLLLLGLVSRRTRFLAIAGTVLAFGFHFVMSLNGYQNFSSLGLAMYIAFMPKDLWQGIAAGIATARQRWGQAFHVLVAAIAIGLMLFGLQMWLYSVGQVINESIRWPGEGRPARAIGWAVTTFFLCPLIIFGWAWFQWRRRHQPHELAGRGIPAWAYGLFAVVCFNGLCPFLGLKTENSFAMFSNILTEGHRWNHVFLPKSMQVFDYQSRMVTVHQVTVPGLTHQQLLDRNDALGRLTDLTDERFRVVEWEFRRLTADACGDVGQPISIVYDIDGARYDVADAHQAPELSTPHPYWPSKLMMFRWVPNNPHGICLH